jgi:peroxin-5
VESIADSQNLAISYVNESLDLAALTVLHQYLTLSAPQLAGPKPLRSNIASDAGPWVLHQSLTEQYLAVARHQYETKGEVDPDVQVGLGTLYYMMGEYGDARGCWVNALGERPDVSTG